ncbi:succinylglutamate desuccinylase/aspartoacylase family protein [Xanthomonadaceae bacterium XH05]|nr:succinylglutamate desuccinylase/aspartoacylase family protein [Xanthomonadaceae bacterium XH05]
MRSRRSAGWALAIAGLVAAPAAADESFVGPPPLSPAGDPASSEFVGPVLVGPFEILDAQVLPGKRARLEWNANMNFSGSEVVSPVVVVHGVRPGPVLCLTAGIHGDELNSVEIVRRIANRVEPGDLGGTLIAVPIVNLFGFSRNSRYLPDRRDLNRFFPGSRYGSIASRIADSFFAGVMSRCEALVDLHTGSFDRSNLPQVRADLSRPEVREFTQGFGATPVLHSRGSRGMLRTAALNVGIPAVTFEVGGPGELEPVEIAHGEQALETLMHKLGMTRHLPAWDEPQPVFYESTWVRADAGGMLLSHVALGDRVEPGQVLGVVIDPISNIEREIVSPVHGNVIGMARNQVVLPGFAAFHLGEEASEQQIVRDAQRGSPGVADEDGLRESDDPDALPLDEELDED